MVVDEFEAVQGESDPLAQARSATELLSVYQQRSVELARLRRQAIERAAAEQGLSYTAIADRVGVSKGRVTQIRQTAPAAERRLFGVGPLTVAVPLRALGDRALGVIAAEDSLSAERLTAYLTAQQFQVQQFRIPTGGQWEPPTDAIAICGPKSSPVTATAIESDPFLSFAPDDAGRWAIRDRATGQALTSPLDHGQQSTDLAYVGRLAYQDRTLLIIAGVHALGSLGAVDYLTSHAAEVYAAAGTRRFSFVVRSEFDGMDPVRHELLAPVRTHD